MAGDHILLVIIYRLLEDHVEYQKLGADCLDKPQPQRLTRYLVKRLESLGYRVTLVRADQAALRCFQKEQAS